MIKIMPLITCICLLLWSTILVGAYDINEDQDTASLMVSIAERNYVDVMASFLDKGVKIDIENVNGYTALGAASENGRKEMVQFLLSRGASRTKMKPVHHSPSIIPEISDDYEVPKIFIFAVRWGIADAMNILLAKGVPVNSQDSGGNNALTVAAIHGHLDIAATLLKKGANVNEINGIGLSPVAMVINSGGAEGVELIFRHGGKCTGTDLEWYTIKIFGIITGTDINFETKDPDTERTVLMIAAEKNHHLNVRYLVKRGANINATFYSGQMRLQPYNGSTALIFALRDYQGVDAAYELIRLKASLDNLNNTDESALICAVIKADIPMVKALLDAGASVNRADGFGKTPYYHAMMNGDKAMMTYLKSRGGR